MHSHEHDVDAAVSLRPKGARLTEAEPALAAQAAAQGRWDAVGTSGIAHLQRVAGNAGVAAALGEEDRSPVHDVVSSGGRALDPDVRADMEGRLGHDFGDVRVHDDSRAHDRPSGSTRTPTRSAPTSCSSATATTRVPARANSPSRTS